MADASGFPHADIREKTRESINSQLNLKKPKSPPGSIKIDLNDINQQF